MAGRPDPISSPEASARTARVRVGHAVTIRALLRERFLPFMIHRRHRSLSALGSQIGVVRQAHTTIAGNAITPNATPSRFARRSWRSLAASSGNPSSMSLGMIRVGRPHVRTNMPP